MLYFLLLGGISANVQSRDVLVAAYIFKIAELIQWPEIHKKDFFHLHLIDPRNHIKKQLNAVAELKRLHGKELKITRGTNTRIPETADLIFIQNSHINLYSDLFSKAESKNTLFISDRLENDQFALIDLQESSDNKIYFRINKANILNRGLNIHPDIILLGGTEIDVAHLFKEGLLHLKDKTYQVDQLAQEVDTQKQQRKELIIDLQKVRNEERRLAHKLSQAREKIEDQNHEINLMQELIEDKKSNLAALRTRTLDIQKLLSGKNKEINSAQRKSDLLELAIYERTKILDEKNHKILSATNQLEEQDVIITNQKRFLILIIVIGALLMLLFTLTYIGYRNKRRSNMLLEKQSHELVEAKKIAEHHTLAKSMFLSNMSHELRSPLNSIIGFSQLIDRNPETPSAIKEHSSIVSRSANHLLSLINDVLEIAKIESGEINLFDEDINFFDMVRDVENISSIEAEEKGIKLVFDFSSTCPCFIKVDVSKLRRIFINLVNNAIKFTEKGIVSVSIKCAPAKELNKLRMICEVADTGIGIAPENLKKVFLPFEQVLNDHNASQSSGSGLGLSISKELVEKMKGTINVKSTMGVGSNFLFDIIVSTASKHNVAAQLETEIRYIGSKPGQKMAKTLIVEDLEDNELYLRSILDNFNCEIKSTANGKEAVEAFKSSQPDIIFMDNRMPVMSGTEAGKLIRQLPGGEDVKIIAVTASVYERDEDTLKKEIFDDCIRKPYLIEEVRDCLTKHLKMEFQYQRLSTGKKFDIDNNIEYYEKTLELLTSSEKNLIKSAILALDMEKTISAIDVIKTKQPELAENLQKYVENYDFTYLQSIIKKL